MSGLGDRPLLRPPAPLQLAPDDVDADSMLAAIVEFLGGIAGKVLAKAAEPFVKMNIESSVDELKRQAGKLGAKSSAKGW